MSFEEIGITAKRCFIVAEIAQAHDGSLGTAHAYIDAAADAGVDAVKFQTHIAAAESTLEEPWRVRFSRQDSHRFDYWKRMEFNSTQWNELQQHCAARQVEFISSPFSPEAVSLLDSIGMRLWKIASGEIYNPLVIDAVLNTGKPVIYSSGMSDLDELEEVINQTRFSGNEVAVLQCTTSYPCPAEDWGLNVISEMASRFHCPAGFSDHSGSIYAGLAAAALGASILEVHITFSKKSFGPDVLSSITPDQLSCLVEGVRLITASLNSNFEKSIAARKTETLKLTFGRSLALRNDMPAGSVIDSSDLTLKKPGGGIGYDKIGEVAGMKLRVDKQAIHLLQMEDLIPNDE